MNVVTIPKHIVGKGDLVVIPRVEYEALVALTSGLKPIYEPLIPTDSRDPDFGLELTAKAKKRLRLAQASRGKKVSLTAMLRKYI